MANPADPPASQPKSVEQALYDADVRLAEVLLGEPSADALARIAQSYRSREDHARAAVFGLTALRGKPNDPQIEYELACIFAQWGQKPLAMRYLSWAADHGYWGYRVITEDTDLDAIKGEPSFAAVLAKVKKSYDAESPKHAPGQTVKVPAGQPPAGGWPVMVSLHGWGSSRHDFDDAAEYVATLGYVGISLDGNEVMGPAAYTWTGEAVARTHARVATAVAGLKVKADAKRVYLHGFSQGAMHAARLLADHREAYAGAIVNSPGSPGLLPTKLADPAKTGPLVLSVGDHEHPSIGQSVGKLESLWRDAKRPVRVIRFAGGHQFPPDAEPMFRDALKEMAAAK